MGDFTTLYDRCLRSYLDLFEVWNSPNDRSASPHPERRIEPIGFGWCIIIIILLSPPLIVILQSRKRPDAPRQRDRQADRQAGMAVKGRPSALLSVLGELPSCFQSSSIAINQPVLTSPGLVASCCFNINTEQDDNAKGGAPSKLIKKKRGGGDTETQYETG